MRRMDGVFLLKGALVTLMAVYAGAVALITVFQRSMLYLPDPERVTPAAAGLTGIAEVEITTTDGQRLVAWWRRPDAGRATLLYFHGNGGNISYRADRARLAGEAGFGLLMVSARGYGGSTGAPSERALVADGRTAYDWLIANEITPRTIVAAGESLGSGIAVQLAAAVPVGGLILDSPYSSLVDVAALRMPALPVRLLMFDRFDSIAHIGRVHAPLLQIHGDQDDVVPYDLGQRLFAAANEPKRLLTLPRGGHVMPWRGATWAVIAAFLDRVR